MEKPIVYVDMDGVLVNFPESIIDVHISIQEECGKWCSRTGRHHSDFEGIFATLQPMNGAIEAVSRLSSKYEVYLLSSAPWGNISSWVDKRRWVENYLPDLGKKHLILSHRKDLNRGAYLIDDRLHNGASDFGKYTNQEWIHFGSDKFSNWVSVLNYLGC